MSKATNGSEAVSENGRPRSADFAARGVRTAGDFAGLMSSLMSDVLEGRVTPGVCNAAVNAGGKLLKVVDMAHKYGKVGGDGNERHLSLTGEVTKDATAITARDRRLAELRKEIAELEAKS